MSQNDTIHLNSVEIKSSRTPQIYSESARIIRIITNEELKNSPVQSISELMEYVIGVDIRQRGNNDIQADISIRGGTFEQTLILLNGIIMNDPQTGHHSMNLPISLDDVDRIEILEGPGSRIYGANAFSGAINIITHSNFIRRVRTNTVYGDFNFLKAGVSLNLPLGKSINYFSFNRSSSNGYIENTDFKSTNLFYQNSSFFRFGKLNIQTGYNTKNFGANSFYTPKYPNQYEETSTKFASLNFISNGKIKINPNIYYRKHQDMFQLFRENPPTWYKNHNYHMTDVYGFGLNLSTTNKLGRSAIGIDSRYENILSNVLGEVLDFPVSVPGYPEGEFKKSKQRNNTGVFAEHVIYLKQLSISAGLMANLNSDFGMKIFPGVDIGYSITTKLKLIGSYNESLRFPTFTDLYYVGPTNLGNPNLEPEFAKSYELGSKFFSNTMTIQGSVFKRYGKNIIDWVRIADSLKWESKNLTMVEAIGINLSYTINFEKLLKSKYLLKKLTIAYVFMDQNKESGKYNSYYAMDYLKQKLVAGINHKIYRNFEAEWRIVYQDRCGTYTDFPSGIETAYKPFILVDAKVTWKKGMFNAFVEGTNLFNIDYFDFGNIQMPGRWMKGGLIFNFPF